MDWLLQMLSPEQLQAVLGQAFSSEVFKFSCAFSLAAMIHAKQVRKEIGIQFTGAITAINDLTSVLRQDLEKQSKRIGMIEAAVGKIDGRLTKIEKPKDG